MRKYVRDAFILAAVTIPLMGSNCSNVEEPVKLEVRSICIEEHDEILPLVLKEEIATLNRVLIMPIKMRRGPAAFFEFFASGLEKEGWKVVDSETVVKTDDPVADIQLATGSSSKPDVVAFYVLRNELLDKWTKLSEAPFVKVLITEDLHYDHDTGPTKRFMDIGDAVFARYPQAFTKVVSPKRILAFSFYHAATEPFFTTPPRVRKEKALLSGAVSADYYPLRNSALRLSSRRPHLVEQLVHPGWTFDMKAADVHAQYAQAISSFQIAIAGGAPQGPVPAPYLISKHFEIPATGTFMITDEFLEHYLSEVGLQRNVHYVAANPQNLESVIEHWLRPENAAKRAEIAANGRKLVSERHTMTHRIAQFNKTTARIYKALYEGHDGTPHYHRFLMREIPANGEVKIPKVIHQVWHSWKKEQSEPPKQHQDWTQKLLELHPGWTYKMWKEVDCEQLLKNHYPQYLNLYKSYDKDVKRVDMIKYFILHHEGGLMMNTGFMPLCNVEPLLLSANVILGEQYDKEYFSIANGLMASTPKHPLWELAFTRLEEYKSDYVLKATGPRFLTHLTNKYAEIESTQDVRVLPRKYLYPFSWNKDELDAEPTKACLENPEKCQMNFESAFLIYVWPGSWFDQY